MSSSWITQMGTKSSDKCPYESPRVVTQPKEEEAVWTARQGWEWRGLRSRNEDRHGTDSPLGPPEAALPCLVSDCQRPELSQNEFLCCKRPRCSDWLGLPQETTTKRRCSSRSSAGMGLSTCLQPPLCMWCGRVGQITDLCLRLSIRKGGEKGSPPPSRLLCSCGITS